MTEWITDEALLSLLGSGTSANPQIDRERILDAPDGEPPALFQAVLEIPLLLPSEGSQNLPGTCDCGQLEGVAIDLAAPAHWLAVELRRHGDEIRIGIFAETPCVISQLAVASGECDLLMLLENQPVSSKTSHRLGSVSSLVGETLHIWIVLDSLVATSKVHIRGA